MPIDDDTGECVHCGEDIEYHTDNMPPWTHTNTGVSDCPVEEGEEPSGFHAEPNRLTIAEWRRTTSNPEDTNA
jgi:hypothetical protein